MIELIVDPTRYSDTVEPTGICVRAALNGKWGNFDIFHLTATSLRDWLRSRGGLNVWAEETIFILFGFPVIDGTNSRIPA